MYRIVYQVFALNLVLITLRNDFFHHLFTKKPAYLSALL